MLRVRNSKSADVGVIGKVIKILEMLRESPSGVELKRISHKTGINKSTAYRFLSHLERAGYVLRDDAGAYMIGMKLLQLGTRAERQGVLQKISWPALHELWKATGETVNFCVLDSGTVLYLAVLESPHEFRLVSTVGMRRALHSTGVGKALAAFLPSDDLEALLGSLSFSPSTPHTITNRTDFEKELERVRHQGYALDNEEAHMGARCIAAPILNSRRETVAAVSVASPSTRLSLDKVPLLARVVQEAARTISTRLGFQDKP